jgi:hypothetical protein
MCLSNISLLLNNFKNKMEEWKQMRKRLKIMDDAFKESENKIKKEDDSDDLFWHTMWYS